MFQTLLTIIISAAVSLGSVFGLSHNTVTQVPAQTLTPQMSSYIDSYVTKSLQNQQPSTNLGTALPIAGNTFTLAGSGVSGSASSITLQSFTVTQTGQKIVDADMSDTFFLTIEPGNRSKQEIVSCTTVVQNAAGTATLSGCSRGLSPITPYTASTTLQFAHAGGAQVIFSDPPQLFNLYGAKQNDETITGDWKVSVPVGGTSIANKNYVLSVVTGGTISTDTVVVAGTAGETLVAGNIVYLRTSDARWYKTDSTLNYTLNDVMIGVSQGAGTAGNAITGGVLTQGVDANQSGLTAGANYFVSSTPGSITTSTTTRSVGKAKSATSLYFSPSFLSANVAGMNNFTASTTFAATTTFAANSSNKISFNGIPYVWPSTAAATASTTLVNTSGTLTWGGASSALIGSCPAIAINGSTASTTVCSVTIPAGTLATANTIKLRVYFPGTASDVTLKNTADLDVEVGYGSASTTLVMNNSAGGDKEGTIGSLDILLQGNGATNSQRVMVGLNIHDIGAASVVDINYAKSATLATDSTASQVLTVVVRQTNSGGQFDTDGIATIEVLRQ